MGNLIAVEVVHVAAGEVLPITPDFLDSRVVRRCSEPERAAPVVPHGGAGECPVCLETLGDRVVRSPSCGHRFCSPCMLTWLRTSTLCPLCKMDVSAGEGCGGSVLEDSPFSGGGTGAATGGIAEENGHRHIAARELSLRWHLLQIAIILAGL
jgi:hypothetical protein